MSTLLNKYVCVKCGDSWSTPTFHRDEKNLLCNKCAKEQADEEKRKSKIKIDLKTLLTPQQIILLNMLKDEGPLIMQEILPKLQSLLKLNKRPARATIRGWLQKMENYNLISKGWRHREDLFAVGTPPREFKFIGDQNE